MSPRMVGESRYEHTLHTFAWSLLFERPGPSDDRDLFDPYPGRVSDPPRRVGMKISGGTAQFDQKMYICGISANRPDVVITANIGTAPFITSGPWIIDPELSMLSYSLIVPVRQWVKASVKLMPGAPCGLVHVWWRVVFSTEVTIMADRSAPWSPDKPPWADKEPK